MNSFVKYKFEWIVDKLYFYRERLNCHVASLYAQRYFTTIKLIEKYYLCWSIFDLESFESPFQDSNLNAKAMTTAQLLSNKKLELSPFYKRLGQNQNLLFTEVFFEAKI